jgi:hypothetical protein
MLRFVLLVSAMFSAALGDSTADLGHVEGSQSERIAAMKADVHPSRVRRTRRIRQVPDWLTAPETSEVKDFLLESMAQGDNGFCWRDTENCPDGTKKWYDDGGLIKTCVGLCPEGFRDDGEPAPAQPGPSCNIFRCSRRADPH